MDSSTFLIKCIKAYPSKVRFKPVFYISKNYEYGYKGEFSVSHFAVVVTNHYNLSFLFHKIPITAEQAEAVWNETFVLTSTHGQQWESSPSPFDLESNGLATCSHILPYSLHEL